jgi:hypothetical protein
MDIDDKDAGLYLNAGLLEFRLRDMSIYEQNDQKSTDKNATDHYNIEFQISNIGRKIQEILQA